MTPELAQKKLDYWCEKLDLYDYCDIIRAAQDNPKVRSIVKRLGYRIPKEKLPKSRVKYVVAEDDWFPCYRGNKVAVTYQRGTISVSGDDDFGMWLPNATQEQYDKLISAPISVERCKDMGFQNCG